MELVLPEVLGGLLRASTDRNGGMKPTSSSSSPASSSSKETHLLTGKQKILEFVLGGKSLFTVKNSKTGNRATYRVSSLKSGSGYEVLVMTGSDNTDWDRSYAKLGELDSSLKFSRYGMTEYLAELDKHSGSDSWCRALLAGVRRSLSYGGLRAKQSLYLAKLARKHDVRALYTSGVTGGEKDVRALAFPYLWSVLTQQEGKTVPAALEVWHEGRCCRCCRVLTVPASVEMGYGPDCAEDIGRLAEWVEFDTRLGRSVPSAASTAQVSLGLEAAV